MLRSRVSSALASAARTARSARPPPPSLLQLRQPRQQKHFTAPGLLQKHFISSTSCAQSGPGGASHPAPPPSSAPGTPAVASSPDAAASPHASQPQEPRLSLTFTCTVSECGTRSTHEFTRRSYQKGIVIVKCPGCENKHLIADHLGWFKESMEDGKLKTIEDLMRAKGENVKRGRIDAGGVIEYAPE